MSAELLALDMEYRLTIAVRLSAGECACPSYLARRREVLIPEVLRIAAERGEDSVDVFAAFQHRLHTRTCEGGAA